MNVKSIEKEGSKATVVVEVEKDVIESGKQAAYQKAAKDIMIPGFRKGKAPRKIVEAMYGADVFLEDGINEAFPEIYAGTIAKEESLKPVGMPQVVDLQFPEDGGAVLTIETDLYPEVKLGDYKGLEIPKIEATVGEDEIDAEVERMAQNIARVETVSRAAKEGDTAVIDFEGFDNGKAFKGGKGENYELKLGSGAFVPGFEEQVTGMSAGEEKDIDITFPEDYQKDLAGKAVVFHVKVNEVKETIVPEKDDEFVKDVSEFETMAQLREDIKTRFTKQKEESIQSAFENAAVEKASANMTAEIPESMISEEVDRQMERFGYQLQMSGMSLNDYAKMTGGNLDALRDSMKDVSEKHVREMVLLDAVVDAENITASDEEVEAEYQKTADQYKMELKKVKELLQEKELRDTICTRKAAKLIADSAVAVAPKAEKPKTTKPKTAAKPKSGEEKAAKPKSETAKTTTAKTAAKPKTAAKKTTSSTTKKTTGSTAKTTKTAAKPKAEKAKDETPKAE